jgi:hypothetical protein
MSAAVLLVSDVHGGSGEDVQEVDGTCGVNWSIGVVCGWRVDGDDGSEKTEYSLTTCDKGVSGTSRWGGEELGSVSEQNTVCLISPNRERSEVVTYSRR